MNTQLAINAVLSFLIPQQVSRLTGMASHPSTAYQAVPPTKTLEMFAAGLSSSVKNAIGQRRYTDVFVLAFHWENDDMGVAPLEAQLLEVFSEIYHYEVESYIIPIVSLQFQLVTRLGQWFERHQGEDILRIVVYSGHADSPDSKAKNWRLA